MIGSETKDLFLSPMAMMGIPIVMLLAVLYFLRPRHAKKSIGNAPPMVLSSPIVKVPLIGQVLEFGLSPVKMTKRCYDKYGPVFTVPVSYHICALLYCHALYIGSLDIRSMHAESNAHHMLLSSSLGYHKCVR